ncbi:MAG: hypothetical protein HFE73_07345 [Firmicutes bacterium]|nr:hypothetical protein [Bacillota bacterium]
MKTIYLLLTRTNTVLSKCIHAATRNDFTHVALSLDDSFEYMYSFGRKYKWSYLPAGFVRESVRHGLMGGSNDIACAVYELKISNRSYKKLVRILSEMEENREDYRYNIVGLPMCFLHIANQRRHHFFCSQFVSYVLIECGAMAKKKEPSLMRPMDFPALTGARRIFHGNIAQLRGSI